MSKTNTSYWAKASTTKGRALSRLMCLLNEGVKNPELSEDVCKIIQVLMETDTKTKNKLKSKMSHKERAFMNVPSNTVIASRLSILSSEFSIRDIAEFLKYKDTVSNTKKGHKSKKSQDDLFSICSYTKEIVEEWKAKSLRKLSYDQVINQFMSWVFQDMRPTDLQYGIHNLMKSSGQISKLVVAPTGAGKTFGFGAVMGICTDSLLCYSPANRTSMQDFIGATTEAGVPVCFAYRDPEDTDKLIFSSIFETMGKSKQHGLQNMVDELKKNKQMRRTRYKTHLPRIVVCDPSLRANGLIEVFEEVTQFCATIKEDRTLHPTVVIDDFCASLVETRISTEVHRIITTAERLILLTATKPTDMNLVNQMRANNSLEPITLDTYPKTLGMGVSLFNEIGEHFSLLDNLDVFDHSPFALSTLSPQTVFSLMKEIHGEVQARNHILSRLPNVTLDDLREDIISSLKEMTPSKRSEVISKAEVDESHNVRGQCLILDTDPLARMKSDNDDITYKYRERPWINGLSKEVERYMSFCRKNQEIADKCAASKRSQDDKDDGIKYRGAGDSELSATPPLVFPELNSAFTKIVDVVKDIISTHEVLGISEEEMYYILQKKILLVTKSTPRSWIGKVLPYVDVIYGDESMSAGVHISQLCKVVLPRQNIDAFTLIQSMGRVGRPFQGCGIVHGTTEQFNIMFSKDVGDEPAQILNDSIKKIYDLEPEEVEVVEEKSITEEVEDEMSSSDEKKKTKRSAEARKRRNKKKKCKKKKNKNK